MVQYCFACGHLSSVVVCNAADGQAGHRACEQSDGRRCTVGQYGYVPSGQHLVSIIRVVNIAVLVLVPILLAVLFFRVLAQVLPILVACSIAARIADTFAASLQHL